MSHLASEAANLPDFDPIFRSTFQPDLEQFEHPLGRVPFVRVGRVTLTLGAPVCEPANVELLTRAFLAAHPDATFFYVTGAHLQAMRLPPRVVMPVGEDTVLDLPLASVPDTARSALRKATKAGLTLEEPMSLGPVAEELRRVQAAYLAAREVKTELRFLNRPCEFEEERLGRTLVLRQKGVVVGFVVLDGYRTAEGKRGYLLNLFRLAPTKLWNVYQAVVLLLAERLAAEGVVELSLGFIPLTPVDWQLDVPVRLQHAALRLLAKTSPYLQRLAVIKHGFPSRSVTRYAVTKRWFVLGDFRAFLRAMEGA